MLYIPHSLDGLFSVLDKVKDSAEKTQLVVSGADHGIAQGRAISRYQYGQTLSVLKIAASSHSSVSRVCSRSSISTKFLNIGCVSRQEYENICSKYYFGSGTNDISIEAAMAEDQVLTIFEAAHAFLATLYCDQICLGEVGIGNTLSSTALTAVLLKCDLSEIVGIGSGVDQETVQRKRFLIETAISRHQSASFEHGPLSVLGSLGGLKIAWNVGIILAAKKLKKTILLDGYITGVSALVAVLLDKSVLSSLIATHVSREPGHRKLLNFLGLKPYLDFDLALGQGFGAALGAAYLLQTHSLLK